jgi:hypothetical protein
MPFVVYMDETGDHSLTKIDNNFPVFCLTLLAFDQANYIETAIPLATKLKFDYWGHENVILHSRDIRKAQGDFGFLTDVSKRLVFYERINRLMLETDYNIICSVIDKKKLIKRYTVPHNPYELSLKFALERLLLLIESTPQHRLKVIAEARGKKEDDELRLSFLEITTHGTEYSSSARFRQVTFELVFVSKKTNCLGTQMADLVGYPISRHVIKPGEDNKAFEMIKGKIYSGSEQNHGLKIFP